jgi:hypothetical protein
MLTLPPQLDRHCEERSDEAIQGASTVLAALDCFVAERLLAMTVILSSSQCAEDERRGSSAFAGDDDGESLSTAAGIRQK